MMTKVELWAYIIAQSNDEVAFHAFVDRFTSDAPSETFAPILSQADVEAIAQLIQQKVEQTRTS